MAQTSKTSRPRTSVQGRRVARYKRAARGRQARTAAGSHPKSGQTGQKGRKGLPIRIAQTRGNQSHGRIGAFAIGKLLQLISV